MDKKYFTLFLLWLFIIMPVSANNAVFSVPDAEEFNFTPLNTETKKPETTGVIPNAQNKTTDLGLSNVNFLSAINNLDDAQVEIREQLSVYSTLMAKSKTEYEAKKAEYKSNKNMYCLLKKRLKSVERSKRLIQQNVQVQSSQN